MGLLWKLFWNILIFFHEQTKNSMSSLEKQLFVVHIQGISMPLNALPFQLCTVVTAEHKNVI